ncbi:hypothetical protein N7516_004648 [Penicillium verrucosum]|uniref:uncharacterized protein n=1 Tax=Penicillium verrucosum TaxID=60171 RepID=UPI002545236B|nr:uncharacterized protein N7516_004648 [Penicillium verrucosum]KAJ5944480.1 hypothetical protein N7516_004648 [Penicillium verrucosum]
MKGFIGGIPVALLAVAAQAKFAERQEHDFHPQAGGTAIGGPSGNDNDGGFVSPYSASIKTDTKVNQWNKDDHSVKLKHSDVYPRPPVVPVHFGHPAVNGPQVPGMGPFGKGKRVPPGGTAMGGPSGNDEGQSFDFSVTGIFNTEVEDENKDDHSTDIKNKHVHPADFGKRFGPHAGGGTAIGGPSGNDGGQSFGAPTNIQASSDVNEHNEDDHSIGIKNNHVHPAAFWKRFGPHAGGGGTAMGGPSGNDGGQSFSTPTNILAASDVSEHNEDDHSIGLEHEDIYTHPFGPFRRSENHGPPGHGGPPPSGHFEPHPESHFEPHPESHYEPHTESHYQPHSEPHYEPHPEPHFENHPEPHTENHPEPHYAPHYSPTYAPHYEPHTTVEHDITSLKNNNNGPSAGTVTFGRRGFPGRPESHFEPHPESHFEPHPESHYAPHTESHYQPHSEPHYEPHPEPHFENHPEPHVEHHPEPHYEPHYNPSYAPHYEPHTTLEHELTSLKNNNNGPAAGSIAFGRRGFPGRPESHFEPHPESHFEPHPESHYAPHTESHYQPHSEPHYEPHPEPHFENHPEPHTENHPEPHYAPHYSPSYNPHYEPHKTLENEITSLKNNNNGPSAGSIAFGRRGFPTGPGPESHFEPHPESHFEPHPESHYAPHTESHYEPHSEPHYEPHPEPHFENHPEPHTENHPEPHYAPHYSPSYNPHYEPHHTFESEVTELKNTNNGPSAGSIPFGRRAYAPTPETSVGGGTAIGGPSGNDGGSSFSTPTEIDVDSDVNEHNEDNHAIKGDFTHVHPGASPEYAREENVETPQCAAHEVVHTVTKTHYKTAEATRVAYQSPPTDESNGIPAYAPHDPAGPGSYDPYDPAGGDAYAPHHPTGADAYAPHHPTGADAYAPHHPTGADAYAPHHPTGADAYAPHHPAGADAFAPSGPAPSSPGAEHADNLMPAHVPMAAPSPGPSGGSPGRAQSSPGANPYRSSVPAPSAYAAQRPSYSKIAVHVPMATPASYGAFSQATPSNSMGKMVPTGAAAENKASPSSSVSASASVSHGVMFEGGAARLSGGVVSAAAAVMGVLAFIL